VLPLPYTYSLHPVRCLYPVPSTLGDCYHDILAQKWHSWENHVVRFRGLCGQMPLSMMDVSHYGHRYIGHVPLYIHQLYILLLVDGLLAWYGFTNIRSHSASDSCCSRIYWLLWNVYPGSYFQWLHWVHRGGLTGVWVAAVSHWVAHWMTCLSFSSIQIHSHLADILVEPWLAGVEKVRKMITKRSGKSWRIYS